MSTEQLDQIAEKAGIEESERPSFRIGFLMGKVDGLAQGQKMIDAVFNNPEQDALSRFTRDQFLNATSPASDEDIRMKLQDDLSSEIRSGKYYEDNMTVNNLID